MNTQFQDFKLSGAGIIWGTVLPIFLSLVGNRYKFMPCAVSVKFQ